MTLIKLTWYIIKLLMPILLAYMIFMSALELGWYKSTMLLTGIMLICSWWDDV